MTRAPGGSGESPLVFDNASSFAAPDRKIPSRYPFRILVVDDDKDVREAIVAALVDEGHDVIGLESGTQVLECLGIFSSDGLRPPDLIAMDVRMPGPSGIDLLEFMRRSGWATPVVIMTAHGATETRSRVEEAGLATFIEKPFELEFFCTLARAILRVPPSSSALPASQR